jgi:hypothetical protein
MGGSTNEAGMSGFVQAIADLSDADSIAEFLALDVVAEDWMAPGHTYEGKEAVLAETFAPLPESFPDVRFVVTREIRADDVLILCGFFEATFARDYWNFQATGRRVRWEARDIYRFRDGLIDRIWWANDTLTVARELGADIPDERLW